MLLTDIPVRFEIPFAKNAPGPYISTPIPLTTPTPGRASLDVGFPAVNFLPRGSGGIPPFGVDFNGLMFQVTSWNQWHAAGGPIFYNTAFATAIGGYPNGACLLSANYPGLVWQSTADNNLTDPDDFATAANWICVRRWKLSAATNLYVRADGNDNNSGLANSVGGAWLTPQRAADFIQKYVDVGAQILTVNIGAGTFGVLGVSGPFPGAAGPNSVRFIGAGSTTILSGAIPISGTAVAAFTVAGVQSNFSDRGVIAQSNAVIIIGIGSTSVTFNSIGGTFHIDADSGGIIIGGGNISIQGNSNAWAAVAGPSTITIISRTLTFVGTPAFSNAGVFTQYGYIQFVGNTYVGTTTGLKYSTTYNGMIEGVTGLPGSGTNQQNGGQFL